MEASKGVGPSRWEAEDDRARDQDPARLLSDLLLGRAGAMDPGVRQPQIRASSAMVLGGVTLGLGGFAAVAAAQMVSGPPFALRELGGVLGGAAIVVLLLGILVGLPAHRGLRVLGLGGVLIGAIGIAAFVGAYPQNWGRLDVDDHTVPVLGTYVAGVVLLVCATFASLVADFVLRMQVRSRLRGELGREPTDEEIQRDIDEAMRRHRVTWGGMAPDEGKGLKFKADALPADWQVVMPKLGRETVATGERMTAVDTAVDTLVKFRGGRSRTGVVPDAGLGDAADALKALRTERAARKPSFLDRLLGRGAAATAPRSRFAGWMDWLLGPPGGPKGPG